MKILERINAEGGMWRYLCCYNSQIMAEQQSIFNNWTDLLSLVGNFRHVRHHGVRPQWCLISSLNRFIHVFPPVCRSFLGVHQHDISGSQPCGEKRLGVRPRGFEHCGSLHLHQWVPEPRLAGQSCAAVPLTLSAAAACITPPLLLHQDLVLSLLLPDWLRTSSLFLRQLTRIGRRAKACRGKKE